MSGLANAEVNQRLRLDEFLKPTTCENAKQPWPKSSLCNELQILTKYLLKIYESTTKLSKINGINAVVLGHAMGTGPQDDSIKLYNLFLC